MMFFKRDRCRTIWLRRVTCRRSAWVGSSGILVKRYFYETHDELRTHLRDFLDAYNFARRLKTLKSLTPYEFICKAWTSQPQRFTISPLQKTPGLNT